MTRERCSAPCDEFRGDHRSQAHRHLGAPVRERARATRISLDASCRWFRTSTRNANTSAGGSKTTPEELIRLLPRLGNRTTVRARTRRTARQLGAVFRDRRRDPALKRKPDHSALSMSSSGASQLSLTRLDEKEPNTSCGQVQLAPVSGRKLVLHDVRRGEFLPARARPQTAAHPQRGR
jgi:hypothetical protein